jgi:hypothetical protein
MNIIFASREEAAEMTARYIMLELDTFRVQDHGTRTSWCVLDPASVPMTELWCVDDLRTKHGQALYHYQQAQWTSCLETLTELHGRWAGQVDSFYAALKQRVEDLQSEPLPEGWDGSLTHA